VPVQCHHPSPEVFAEAAKQVRVCAVELQHLSGSQYSLHQYLITTSKTSKLLQIGMFPAIPFVCGCSNSLMYVVV
jgi:hypothetical protein